MMAMLIPKNIMLTATPKFSTFSSANIHLQNTFWQLNNHTFSYISGRFMAAAVELYVCVFWIILLCVLYNNSQYAGWRLAERNPVQGTYTW